MLKSSLELFADRHDPNPDRSRVGRYMYDPVAWARDCVHWRDGQGLTPYQEQVLAELVEHRRVAVRGPHGLGKTTIDAIAILWFATTRDAMGRDWKIPTTASAWHQLTHFLWPEVRKWARRLNWARLGRPEFVEGKELLQQNLKLRYGEAFAIASDQPSSIEGAHADSLLYIFDEAKVIPGETFDATEGAFSGAGTDTSVEAFALANSTPGEPSGRFYEIHARRPGFEDWRTIHVTLDDAVKAGRISREWATQRALQWGETSTVYRTRVLGEFASSDEDSVIPLAWVEAAQARWRAWQEDGAMVGAFTCVGADIARTGNDKTVRALRYGGVVTQLLETAREDTMETTARIQANLNVNGQGGFAVVDVIGIGAGVVDRLKELGHPVVPFNAAEGTQLVDGSGEFGFANKRAAAWWTLRELLDPANGNEIALPDSDYLTGDLTAPKWKLRTGNPPRIAVESKDDIRKRIGRSTDYGDAVVQCFWWEPPEVDELVEYGERIEISQF